MKSCRCPSRTKLIVTFPTGSGSTRAVGRCIPKTPDGERPQPGRLERSWDEIVFRGWRGFDRFTSLVYCYAPISVLRRYRSAKSKDRSPEVAKELPSSPKFRPQLNSTEKKDVMPILRKVRYSLSKTPVRAPLVWMRHRSFQTSDAFVGSYPRFGEHLAAIHAAGNSCRRSSGFSNTNEMIPTSAASHRRARAACWRTAH